MLSQSLLSYLQQPPSQFSIDQVLKSLCKKSLSSQTRQIDFLDFDQKLKSINQFHQKTCDQIVAFVDTHCAQYIQINGKFQSLEDKIQRVQNILKQVNTRVKDYAKIYYQDQAKIQNLISSYETSIIEKLLLAKCQEETLFLTQFVSAFQAISSKSMDNLVFRERALLTRFCYKFTYLQSLFNHHLLHQALPEYIKIYQMLGNLVDEVEFYISQQLSKLNKYKSLGQENNKKDPKIVALTEIKMCYKYLNKLPEYFKNMEQNLIGRQMQVAEKNLLANKINLIGGKNIQVVEEFFRCIFSSIHQFPQSYPRKRLLDLIFTQLRKNEVKFLYTYTLPIFPISYNNYMKFANSLNESDTQLKTALKQNHNWDLKRWVDVRQKNILDRCMKDWQKDTQQPKPTDQTTKPKLSKCPQLSKWIQIIFKQNCKIDGVKTQIVKLGIKVINKYANFIQHIQPFQIDHLNKYIQIHQSIDNLLREKLLFFYEYNNDCYNENKNDCQKIKIIVNKIVLSCKNLLQHSITRIIDNNTKLLSKTCCGCLQPFKSFIMKIIKSSKQVTQYGIINLIGNVFKPLVLYLENNPVLKQESKKWIKQRVAKQVMKFYDEIYVTEVYQYARNNLSVEQLAQVMEIVGKERGTLFQGLNIQHEQKKEQILNFTQGK